MKPITSPDGYRLFWMYWTAGTLLVAGAIFSGLFYWLGPIVIARGLARRKP